MSNIPLNIDWQQILLHLLNFIILASVLSFVLYKPVKKFMDERTKRYEDLERASADNAKKAGELEEQYNERVKAMEAEFKQLKLDAEKKLAELEKEKMDEAEKKAAEIIAEAERQGEEEKKRIIDAAKEDIARMVVEGAEKLMNESHSEATDKALYDRFIAMSLEDEEAKK